VSREKYVRESIKREKYSRFKVLFDISEIEDKLV